MGDSVWARLLPLTGLALGAIWQLVDRRDLTNRLTVAAVLVVLLLLLHAGFGGGYVHVPGVSAGAGSSGRPGAHRAMVASSERTTGTARQTTCSAYDP